MAVVSLAALVSAIALQLVGLFQTDKNFFLFAVRACATVKRFCTAFTFEIQLLVVKQRLNIGA